MILQGDSLTHLRNMPSKSVHCCVTSPPYYGLRDYGTAKWQGGDEYCDHKIPDYTLGGGSNKGHKGSFTANYGAICGKCGAERVDNQIGLETDPDAYVTRLVEVFREVRRVLRDDGTLWINLGDSYAAQGGKQVTQTANANRKGGSDTQNAGQSRKAPDGLKPKDLIGIPWRVAFALQADGWYLRSDIIWQKPNAMPESVKDRPTKAHEYIFLLSKSARYYYDNVAIQEPITESSILRMSQDLENQQGSLRANGGTRPDRPFKPVATIVAGSHASFGPPQSRRRSGNLVRKMGEERGRPGSHMGGSIPWEGVTRNKRTVWTVPTKPFKGAHFAVFPPTLIEPCILAGSPTGGTVLDPFFGAGTTGIVATQHGRDFIGIELNPEYVELARKRLGP